jgi:hypothetical protein
MYLKVYAGSLFVLYDKHFSPAPFSYVTYEGVPVNKITNCKQVNNKAVSSVLSRDHNIFSANLV